MQMIAFELGMRCKFQVQCDQVGMYLAACEGVRSCFMLIRYLRLNECLHTTGTIAHLSLSVMMATPLGRRNMFI